MKKSIFESGRDIPVSGEYDVVVAGGGIAGVSAAIAAARNGARVILLEREYGLGGLATLGLITIYLPMDDGEGHQMVHGIGEELLRLSIKHGAEKNEPVAWLKDGSKEERIANRFVTQFNPHMFAVEMEQLLLCLGVDILYGTGVCGCSMNAEGDRIEAVFVENKSGRSAVAATRFVDSTGDADLAALAGENVYINPGLNSLASWYYYYSKGEVMLRMFGLVDVPGDEQGDDNQGDEQGDEQGEGYIYGNDAGRLASNKKYTGVNGLELSEMVVRSHAAMMEDILEHKGKDPSFVPVAISQIPLVRATRRIEGLYTMSDAETDTFMEDSIGTIPDWRKRGPRYELPFRSLRGGKVKNLLASGRDISVTDGMWEITRVIPPCAVTGEAAGTAAAMADDFSAIDVKGLQKRLLSQGVVLHLRDIDLR